MVRALSAEHEVKVVSPVAWPTALGQRPRMPRSGVVDGAETHYPTYYYTPKILRRGYGEFFWWSVRGTLRSIVSGFRPDVVMGYWAHPDGQAAVRLARTIGVPSVVMVGGTDILVLAAEKSRRQTIRRVLAAADAVVTVSQDLKRAIAGLGVPAGNVHIVHRGVDPQRFQRGSQAAARAHLGLPSNVPALLWVGHMVPVKGLDVLISACALARARADFRLYLIGSGPLRQDLVEQTAALGLTDRVNFVGYVAHDRLGDWYRAADMTVLPSHSEGVPNVLLESIASGTPFVASRVGGVPEIADPLLDRLVAPGNPTALADALVDAIIAPSRLPRRVMPISTDEASARLLQVLTGVRRSSAPQAASSDAWAAPSPAQARATRT
jgi:glycosyltransferase involved in cell wall biosynthesis